MKRIWLVMGLLVLCLTPLGAALSFDLPPPPGQGGAPSHGGPPQYDRPGPGEEAEDALDEASQQLPPSDTEQTGSDVVYYASHTQGQGLGQVFGQFWNIGQDAMTTFLYSVQPGTTGGVLTSLGVAGGVTLGQLAGQAGTMSAALQGLPSGYEAYIPRRWNYAGPGWTSGHDQFWGDDQFFSDCQQYWVNSGLDTENIRTGFERDRAAAGPAGAACFTEPVWGTPDECAYVHDMDYKRASQMTGRAKQETYIIADLKLIACVKQFTDTFGSRHDEYLRMSAGDQAYAEAMVLSFEAMVAKRGTQYVHDIASQLVDDVTLAAMDLTGQAVTEVTQLGQSTLDDASQMAGTVTDLAQGVGNTVAQGVQTGVQNAVDTGGQIFGQAVSEGGQALDTATDLACRYFGC